MIKKVVCYKIANNISMTEHFQLQIEGVIWKQFIDTNTHQLIIEGRNADLHQVNFYTIDLATGKIINTIEPEEETWWLGIEDAWNGKIIVHGYENEQSPIHYGVYCFDALSGQQLWENMEVYFYQKEEQAIWVNSTENIFQKLDLTTGKVLEETTSIPPEKNTEELIELPLHYSEENLHFSTLAKFLEQLQGVQAVKTIEYWESASRIVISYYICDDSEKLENYLLVLSTEGDILFQDCLESQLNGIGMDTFYLYQNQLFFIQEKKTLTCIEL